MSTSTLYYKNYIASIFLAFALVLLPAMMVGFASIVCSLFTLIKLGMHKVTGD